MIHRNKVIERDPVTQNTFLQEHPSYHFLITISLLFTGNL